MPEFLSSFETSRASVLHYAHAREALQDGYELNYAWIAEAILDEPQTMSESECREVIDILSMYSALHYSYEALSDKSGIDEHRVKFIGFSGNDETKQRASCA